MNQDIKQQCKHIFMDEHEHTIAKHTGITIKQRIQTIDTIHHILSQHTPSLPYEHVAYHCVRTIDNIVHTLIQHNLWDTVYNHSTKHDLYEFYIHHILDVIQQYHCTI